ncbi:transmembrane protein, putative (macronuclear) [Tetrahymena thermophila SB210]|uniref:Transmembrane protein, putative n=1 Tax=Tetrahymena thermophila (strain SB210) TaxID=312017 RepID=W7XH29_TETTS|nr:transmembrane protein, putative [Tetrahymena thermophila SB210]EWS73621.1 transmembrane protein, putative [Tetrahymena thermophila SB210]|eukprot:XP_012653851.1 transmembrane protein, putative [Tetrahymena thermophila SB210]
MLLLLLINQFLIIFFIFPSKQLNYNIFFLKYLKSFKKIDAISVSSLGSALANCTNLSNLKLSFSQKQFYCFNSILFQFVYQLLFDLLCFSFYCTCVFSLFLSFLIILNQSHLFFIFNLIFYYYQLIHSFLIISFFFAFKQLNNNLSYHQYFKSPNTIDSIGASRLGPALANCTNLLNLTLDLQQKQFICFGL